MIQKPRHRILILIVARFSTRLSRYNAQIIERADRIVAFWDGRSRGTLNTLVLAERAGLPVEVFGPQGDAMEVATALKAAEELGVFKSIAAGEARAARAKRTEDP